MVKRYDFKLRKENSAPYIGYVENGNYVHFSDYDKLADQAESLEHLADLLRDAGFCGWTKQGFTGKSGDYMELETWFGGGKSVLTKGPETVDTIIEHLEAIKLYNLKDK